MNRLVASVVILCLCFGLSYGQHKYADNYLKSLDDGLEKGKEYILSGENDMALENLTAITEDFDSKSKALRVILGDETINDLEVTLPLITVYISCGDIEESLDTIYTCQAISREIAKSKAIGLSNIF